LTQTPILTAQFDGRVFEESDERHFDTQRQNCCQQNGEQEVT